MFYRNTAASVQSLLWFDIAMKTDEELFCLCRAFVLKSGEDCGMGLPHTPLGRSNVNVKSFKKLHWHGSMLKSQGS